jgi:hypothetical protein
VKVVVLCVVAACTSPPAIVGGEYEGSATDGANGCSLQGWVEGQSYPAYIDIEQEGSTANASLSGFSSPILVTGYTGTIDGNSLQLMAVGTSTMQLGNCTYTYSAEVKATFYNSNHEFSCPDGALAIEGSAFNLVGRISYTAAGDNASDCKSIENCDSYQDLNVLQTCNEGGI